MLRSDEAIMIEHGLATEYWAIWRAVINLRILNGNYAYSTEHEISTFMNNISSRF